jgi:acetylornithine/succinyldiaminopimelate/putrescine aminotransferase
VVRFLPPLVITDEEIEQVIQIVRRAAEVIQGLA